MARRLDDLLGFLLEEIALEGESGLSFQNLVRHVRQFYNHDSSSDGTSSNITTAVPRTAVLKSSIDRPFLVKVWLWLGRHSDVSIGEDRQYNRHSLDEIESLYPGYTLFDVDTSAQKEVLPSLLMHYQDAADTATIHSQSGNQHAIGPRLFVNQERVSIAICGHPPDPTRVFPSEWILLLRIASSRHEGILQGDLTRESGQDKRSVPKRTDALHNKGYIVKKNIFLKGNKTSRLFLRRFADPSSSGSGSVTRANDQITIRHVARQLFDVMKNNPLIPQEDLADALGLTTPGRARILSRLIKYFGRCGCLKRVKTAFGPSAKSQDLQVCIQYLKEPASEHYENHNEEYVDWDQSFEILASVYELEAGTSAADAAEGQATVEDEEQIALEAAEDSSSARSGRVIVPQWNPDRVLPNVLREAACKAGMRGLRNLGARNLITGPFVKRTLECVLVKLANRALQAQPASLRHLAIVRTHEIQNGILLYLHFTFEAFARRVQNGSAKWEDVSGIQPFLKDLKHSGKDIGYITEKAPLDELGLVSRKRPVSQPRNGELKQAKLLLEAKVKDIQPRAGEPSLKKNSSGHFMITYGELSRQTPFAHIPINARRKDKITTPAKPKRIPKNVDENGQIFMGRPRKFTQGTEKYWRDTFAYIIQQRDPECFMRGRKAGFMNDPEALGIFKMRPAAFDQTILKAVEHELPLAAQPRHISQQWIDDITVFMDRSQPGLYITPMGFHLNERRYKSQHLVLRSPRLREVDFSDEPKVWPWQLLSSAASHSHRSIRFYPQLGMTPEHVVASLLLPGVSDEQRIKKKSRPMGPPKGRFYEESQMIENGVLNGDKQLRVSTDYSLPLPVDVEESVDATDSDPDLPEQIDEVISLPPILPSLTSEENKDNSKYRSNINSRNQLNSSLDSLSGVQTRSGRLRRPTQKGAGYLKTQDDKLTETVPHYKVPPPAIVRSTTDRQGSTPPDGTLTSTTQSDICSDIVLPEYETDKPVYSEPNQDSANTTKLPTQGQIDITGAVNDRHSTTQYREEPTVIEEVDEAALKHVHVESRLVHATGIEDVQKQPMTEPVSNTSDTHGNVIVADTLALGNDESPRSEFQPIETPVTQAVAPQVETHEAEQDIIHPSRANLKRTRTVIDEAGHELEFDQEAQMSPSRKRTKGDGTFEATRPQVSKLCRVMVLELLGLCSGLVPNVPWTLRRAMVPRWQEAGVKPEQLNAKNVRAAVKALCESGKLKQITFAFRSTAGAMVKMSVIALRGMDATSIAVIDLQQKMREMEPADYVPPELDAEGKRLPNELNKKRYLREIARDDSPDMDVDQEKRIQRTTRKQKNVRSKSISNQDHMSNGADKSPQLQSVAGDSRQSATPSPEPQITVNTGFLTLRIPRLRELNLPVNSQLRYELPAASSVVEADTTPISAAGAGLRAKPARRGAQRKKRFDPITHKLIWKKSSKPKLPTCLDDIPNMRISREQAIFEATDDLAAARFQAEIDCVATWEVKMAENFEAVDPFRATTLILINHVMPAEAWPSTHANYRTEFKALVQYDAQNGEEAEIDFPTIESWQPFVDALRAAENSTRPSASKSAIRGPRRPSKRKAEEELDEIEGDYDDSDFVVPSEKLSRRAKRQRKPQPKARRSLHTVAGGDGLEKLPSAPLKRSRILQLLRYMTEEEKYQVVVATVIVRTLVGGIEKFIDWRIVSRLVHDQEDGILKDSWKTICNRYRSDVTDMTESLQYRYLDALEKGEVPSINFDEIHASDWEGIYQWALANLDRSIVKRIEELPATRTQLVRRNDYLFTEFRGMRDILGYNMPSTIPRKEEALSSTVFGKQVQMKCFQPTPLGPQNHAAEEESDLELSRAKSWIMATLLAPDTRNATKMQSKLFTVASTPEESEVLLAKAIKALQRNKLISRSHRNMGVGKGKMRETDDPKVARLRQYEPSVKFFEQFDFRRMVTTKMLKRAATYKLNVLDPAFNQNTQIILPKETILDDGEMVAILNLFAMGMLRTKPGNNIPANRWGLEWQEHGYTTRKIDKKALGFSVVFELNKSTYTTGDPFAGTRRTGNVTIPRGEIDRADNQGRIPVWFDILHTFQPDLWEMVLGAVLGLVSTRPGSSTREIARTLWYGAPVLDVEMVLEWAEKMGMIKRSESKAGWESCEWWWMGLGVGGGWKMS